MKIKTGYDLKHAIQAAGHDSHFFDSDTLSFFGDTMENYGVSEHSSYYELYRRNPVKHGNKASAYFRKDNFKRILSLSTHLAEHSIDGD